jgi:pimeloyl-ACP methyl ester carboxylesterase
VNVNSSAPAVAARAHKSTNVRLRLLRALFGLLNRVAPGLAAAWAERLFFTPPPRRRSRRAEAVLGTGRQLALEVGQRRLAAWTWGEGPLVVLVHGWGGTGGQLAAFVAPLVERGFAVATFDAPAHGRSAGARTSLLEFTAALAAIARTLGPIHGIVAHSLGAAATALALDRGLALERAVFVGPPADPAAWPARMAEQLGIAPRVMEEMRRRSERRLRFRWRDLDVPAMARRFDAPLLVVHDAEDAEVGWREGAAIADAWPGARLATTRGLGHRRILRDSGVIAQTVEFLGAGCATPLERLEYELFDREARARSV